ncbi:hypothetical protein ACLOJK_024251 [Asimina triloba]
MEGGSHARSGFDDEALDSLKVLADGELPVKAGSCRDGDAIAMLDEVGFNPSGFGSLADAMDCCLFLEETTCAMNFSHGRLGTDRTIVASPWLEVIRISRCCWTAWLPSFGWMEERLPIAAYWVVGEDDCLDDLKVVVIDEVHRILGEKRVAVLLPGSDRIG